MFQTCALHPIPNWHSLIYKEMKSIIPRTIPLFLDSLGSCSAFAVTYLLREQSIKVDMRNSKVLHLKRCSLGAGNSFLVCLVNEGDDVRMNSYVNQRLRWRRTHLFFRAAIYSRTYQPIACRWKPTETRGLASSLFHLLWPIRKLLRSSLSASYGP